MKIREILTDSQDSLVERKNPRSPGAAIHALLADFGSRARLGARAAGKIQKEVISWARNARRVMSLISPAQAEKARP